MVNGVKTWCTFAARADVLVLLARTDPDRSLAHRGISMFVVEKPPWDGHGFVFTQDDVPDRPRDLAPGRLEGRPIDTLGYRGMHSYELAFENWFVPGSQPRRRHGGGSGQGALTVEIRNRLRERPPPDGGARPRRHAGRLRGGFGVCRGAQGVRVAHRRVHQLTQAKFGRMAVVIQATR